MGEIVFSEMNVTIPRPADVAREEKSEIFELLTAILAMTGFADADGPS